MKYFFDFENNYPILDKRGEVCQTQADAEKFAKQIAAELAAAKTPAERNGEYIVVKDEAGVEVFRISLADSDASPETPVNVPDQSSTGL
jgi:hypothetical protein